MANRFLTSGNTVPKTDENNKILTWKLFLCWKN